MAVLGNLGTMFVRDKNGQMVPVPVIRGEDGGFYTPEIKDGVIRWVASRPDMPAVPDMNIGTGGGGTPDAVQFVPQVLTDKQQAQARENIGAARTYTLKDGETINDAPEDADIVWDPENEGEGAGTGDGVSDEELKEVHERLDALSEEIADLKENGTGGGGLSINAVNVLVSILREGKYVSDQSDRITTLETLLKNNSSGGDGEGTGGSTETIYTVTYNLTNIVSSNVSNTVKEGSAFVTTLTATDGLNLSVTVTMGGVDITDTAYSNGSIAISSVAGNIVITAVTVDTSILYQLKNTSVTSTIDTGVYLANENKSFSACVDIVFEQDFTKGENTTYYILGNAFTGACIYGKFGFAQQRMATHGVNEVTSSSAATAFLSGHAFKAVLTYDADSGAVKLYGATSVVPTVKTIELAGTYAESLNAMMVNSSNMALYVNDITILNRVMTADEATAYVTIEEV